MDVKSMLNTRIYLKKRLMSLFGPLRPYGPATILCKSNLLANAKSLQEKLPLPLSQR